MKLITIFNFPDDFKFNKLCHWWMYQALKNTDLDIEIWYKDNIDRFIINNKRVSFLQKDFIDVSTILNSNLITRKAQHNIGFKLYNLCNRSEPFIFVDADAIILRDISPLVAASQYKPFIAIDHQSIPKHTAHIPYKFLNSGVQICSDPTIIDFEQIIDIQSKMSYFEVPGTEQSMLWSYFKHINYDYTSEHVDWRWNNCAGFIKNNKHTAINHYWQNFKPWKIRCALWAKYTTDSIL